MTPTHLIKKAEEIADYWTGNMLHVFKKCLQMPMKPKWKFNMETKRHVHDCLESALHQAILEGRKRIKEIVMSYLGAIPFDRTYQEKIAKEIERGCDEK